eukprot:scaffold57950_cov30-Tisochrysis_lutea.AAC.3
MPRDERLRQSSRAAPPPRTRAQHACLRGLHAQLALPRDQGRGRRRLGHAAAAAAAAPRENLPHPGLLVFSQCLVRGVTSSVAKLRYWLIARASPQWSL